MKMLICTFLKFLKFYFVYIFLFLKVQILRECFINFQWPMWSEEA